MLETRTVGNEFGKRHIDGIVVERKKREILKAAKDRRKWAGDVGIGKVERDDGVGIGVAGDAEPGAGSVVGVVP